MINAIGTIVGNSDLPNGDKHAFFYADNMMSDMGVLGGKYSSAAAINDGGIIVGSSDTAVFAWTSQQGMVDLTKRLGTATGWGQGAVTDINNRGQIVGSGSHDGVGVGFVMTPKM